MTVYVRNDCNDVTYVFHRDIFRDIHLWFLLFYMVIVIGKMILFPIKYPDPAHVTDNGRYTTISRVEPF